MSYEGYIEYKCACGNSDAADAYDDQPTKCQCGQPFVALRHVDCTNAEEDRGDWQYMIKPVLEISVVPESFCDRVLGTRTSDGGSTDYYRLPVNATELNDLIEHKRMSFALGNIFKACYRFGEKDAASRMYDLNKIIYFAERLKALEERGMVQ